jgi:hypothetical protein
MEILGNNGGMQIKKIRIMAENGSRNGITYTSSGQNMM